MNSTAEEGVMNHTSLEIFQVVAEELSIAKAAKRLGRVQSNVTTRIQLLEEELDVQLFIRENRKIRLSPQGKQFLGYALRILSLAQEAKQTLHPTAPTGKLLLGSMECTAASRLTNPLSVFSKEYPDLKITISTNSTHPLMEKVINSELDCALVSLPKESNGKIVCPTKLCYESLFSEKLLLVLPGSLKNEKDLWNINELNLAVFPRGCSYREITLAVLENKIKFFDKLVIQEISSYHSMLACVASGSSICLLPESVLEILQVPNGLTVLPACIAETQLIWRQDFESPALESLTNILKRYSNIDN